MFVRTHKKYLMRTKSYSLFLWLNKKEMDKILILHFLFKEEFNQKLF